jgi:hypothetical protein
MKGGIMKHGPITRELLLFCLLLICSLTAGAAISGSQKAAAAPLSVPTVFAKTCNQGFFGLEPWYRFMPNELGVPKRGDQPADDCAVRCFNIFVQQHPNACGQKASDLPGVVLAVIDNLLRIAGLAAVFFILKGSFEYVGSRGNAEKTAAAQSTIISALTGLAVALVAVGLITFLGNKLGG